MRPIDEDLGEAIGRLYVKLFIVIIVIMAILFAIGGCASAPKVRQAECHVLTVSPITERIGAEEEGGAVSEKWLAWCGEGRYVVFPSAVTPGERVTFAEYQEDDQLQIHGAISGRGAANEAGKSK